MKEFFKLNFRILIFGILLLSSFVYAQASFIEDVEGRVSELKLKNSQIEEEFSSYRSEVSLELESRDTTILTMRERISIIDEAVNSKDKRSARIKHVRQAIVDTIKNNRYPNNLSPYDLATLAGSIVDASEEFDVPKNLILAVMKRESAFNPKATSHAGAQGLMQVMPATAKECADDIGKRYYDNYSIRDNVRFGTYYLWKMLRRFNGDVSLAVRAYNAGPTMVQKVISEEIADYPSETKAYVQYVLDWKKDYEKLGL